ncbi:MAG TPA: sigma factor-like helix-turn-helix DNA-binding protein [Kofleriaceae bacterium]|nr:sigma factor-like helix-turn-helix DNA-binding protein [Kofleriaceae bacterium]
MSERLNEDDLTISARDGASGSPPRRRTARGTVPPAVFERGDLDSEPNGAAASATVEYRREQRRTRPRSKTIALKRLTRAALSEGALAYPPVLDIARPRTRAECSAEARPCPWVACKHHLYLDINPETGSIKINFPDLEPWELRDTCALDVAERGGSTLDQIGEITNLTRERIRQLEARGLTKLKLLSRELR